MSLLRRCVALTSVTLLALSALATPAAAHGRGSDATNYSSVITATPDLPGLTWEIHNGDEFLSVENTSDQEVVIGGYSNEPYLRIGPEGVFENRLSEAVYLNADRYGAVEVPDFADRTAEPQWVRVADGPAYAWHDHRIHWMSTALPQVVAPDPSVQTEVFPDGWTVPFTHGGDAYEVAGDLTWVPPTAPWPWLLGALVLTSAALIGLRTSPSSEDRWPALARPAAVVLGAVTLLNVTNLVDDLFASPVPITTQLLPAAQTLLFLVIAAFGAIRGWQAGTGAFTALGVGAGALFIGQGVLYLSVLSSSQSASVFPIWVSRAAVAASIAQVIPLGIVTVIGTRRLLPPLEDEPARADTTETANA